MPAIGKPESIEGRNVRAIMGWEGWTVEDLAAGIGCNPATVSRRLSNRYDWTVRDLRRISEMSGVPLSLMHEPLLGIIVTEEYDNGDAARDTLQSSSVGHAA